MSATPTTSPGGAILASLPVGERVGIAFSGGLDTCCAIAWMRERGAVPYAFTADLGQYDEPDIGAVPARALRYGAEDAVLVDCKDALVREALAALQCGAFHIQTAGRRYFNTTPLGRAVTGTLLVKEMAAHGVDIWGDGSTYKGNDIERFYRYGLLANESLRIYKPWLDAAFVDELGGRREMSEWLAARGLEHGTSTELAYSTDANLLGATHEAKNLEHLDTSMRIVEPIMGVAHWDPAVAIEPEEVTLEFADGASRGDRRRRASRARARARRECDRRTARARHVRPDREPRDRGEEPRHLRGAGHGAAAHRLRAPADCDPQRGDARALRRRRTPARPAALRRALVRGAGADAARVAAALGGRAGLGHVIVELRRGDDYTILDTRGDQLSYDPERLSMERSATAFTATDRIGQLALKLNDINDSRRLLERLGWSL